MKLASFVVVAFSGCVNAWWDQGHLLTARRAFDLLTKENPEVLKSAQTMLTSLNTNYPALTKNESADHAFVECATFADVIKSMGYDW
jgi:hypothetical protein